MLAIYSKGEKDNISKETRNALKTLLGTIADDYRASIKLRVVRLKQKG